MGLLGKIAARGIAYDLIRDMRKQDREAAKEKAEKIVDKLEEDGILKRL